MPYETSPEIDFSSIGLVVDVPASQVPTGGWSNSLNVRPRNGSVQGVNSFANDILLHHSDANIANGEAKAICQFTPAGGSNLIIAYIVKGVNGNGSVILYNSAGANNAAKWNNITNATANQVFTFDDDHPPQIFVFNELLIVNPATDAPPQFTTATVAAGSLVELPNWVYDTTATTTAAGSFVTGAKYTIKVVGNTSFTGIGASANTVGVTFTATGVGSGNGTATITAPIIVRVLKSFNTRLIGMNVKEEHNAGTADDKFQPIDLLFSSNISTIASLAAAEWTASTTNTAGDAFLVDTPGKILDGGQLGEFFIAYKSDSVVRVRETGDSFVLAIESIFEDDGIYSTRCFANIGNSQHLVVGNYGVYIHDGQSQKQDIAKDLFKDTMFNLIKPAERNRTFVFQQTRDKEVWFCLPSTANNTTGCDIAFCYDYSNSKIHKRTLPGISDLFETEQNGELKIFGCKSGTRLQVLSNTALEANGFFERTDDNLTNNSINKQIKRIHVTAKGACKLAITGTKFLSDTASYTNVDFNPASTHKVDVRTSGRFMNLKVTMNGTTNPQLTNLQFDIKVIGVR